MFSTLRCFAILLFENENFYACEGGINYMCRSEMKLVPESCKYHLIQVILVHVGCDNQPLWIEDPVKFPKNRFTAKTYRWSMARPYHARMRVETGYGWQPNIKDMFGYLQLDIGDRYYVCGIATKGYSRVGEQEWTETYRLVFSEVNSAKTWVIAKDSNLNEVSCFYNGCTNVLSASL